MELVNSTRMVIGSTVGMEASGRELLVVVVKGTFRLPKLGEDVELHQEQLPLVMADTFTGAPGFSAPMHEVDFALRKHRCDILLLGGAYAPHGRPIKRIPVSLRIGNWTKTFAVVGNRRWDAGGGGVRTTGAESFVSQPFSYDVAFGGVDANHEDPAKHAAFMRNPVGRGFHKHLDSKWVHGTPLPNTEELDRPIDAPDGHYTPMSFGPVGRGWEPRSRYAGTYDDEWVERIFPFLPPDFDEQYYQAAPLDQQLPFPVGGQAVSLVNLTPDGERNFVLPAFEAPMTIFPKRAQREDYNATLDSIVFEPEFERFTMTWRITRALTFSIFEIAKVVVGRRGHEPWQKHTQVAFPNPVAAAPPHADDEMPSEV